jgi:uncharacterized protein (TIGR02266 family)
MMQSNKWDGQNERRSTPRIRTSARVTIEGEPGKYFYTRDLSAGGLFLETDDPWKVGTVFKIEIALPGFRPLIPVKGKVVRVEKGKDGGVGMEFSDLTDELTLLLESAIKEAVLEKNNP